MSVVDFVVDFGRALGRAADKIIFQPIIGFVEFIFDPFGSINTDDEEVEGSLFNKITNTDKIPVVYGQKRIGGTVVFLGSSGDNNEYMHIVLVLCEGEIESIDEVWIDDVKYTDPRFTGFVSIPKDVNSTIAARTSYGYVGTQSQVPSTQLTDDTDWTSSHQLLGLAYLYVRIKYDSDVFTSIPTILCDIRGKRVVDTRTATTTLDGAEAMGQTTLSVTATTGFTATEMASVTLGDGSVFESTIVSISAGVSITIVDPLPSAAASGNLVEAGGYSQNPALCIRDYLYNNLYGRGIPLTAIDDSAIDTAANTCDTRIDPHSTTAAGYQTNQADHSAGDNTIILDRGGSGAGNAIIQGDTFTVSGDTTQYLVTLLSGTNPDYTITYSPSANTAFSDDLSLDFQMNYYEANGVISTDRMLMDNVKLLMTSCRGLLPFTAGKYTLLIEQGGSSTFTFDMDNIIGGWSFSKGSKRYRLNTVKAKFSNPSKFWRTDLVIQASSTYKTEDGGFTLEKEVPLLLETNPYRALYLANTVLKKSRQDITVSFTASLAAMNVRVGDIVDITHVTPGWANKLFRVVSLSLLASGNVGCQLQEHDDLVYNRAAEAGVSFPPDTNLPNPFHTKISLGDVKLSISNLIKRTSDTSFHAVSGNGQMAIASGALISTAIGGEFTTSTPATYTGYYKGIAYGNNYFVAVGSAGSVKTSAPTNLITNGDFTSDTTGWAVYTDSGTAVLSSVSSRLQIDHNGSAIRAYAWRSFSTVVGNTYKASVYFYSRSEDFIDAQLQIKTFSTSGAADLNAYAAEEDSEYPSTYTLEFEATGTTTYLHIGSQATDTSSVIIVDSISVYEVGTSIARGTSSQSMTGSYVSNPGTGLESVAYGNSTFVAVGGSPTTKGNFPESSTNVITSADDGATWTKRTSPATLPDKLHDIIYSTTFVAVGGRSGTGEIYTSSDGATWATQTVPATNDAELFGIVFGFDTYVAVGANAGGESFILTATDPTGTWTKRTSPIDEQLNSVTYGANVFVAVGDSGSVIYSYDGITWDTVVSQLTTITNVHYDSASRGFLAMSNGIYLSLYIP